MHNQTTTKDTPSSSKPPVAFLSLREIGRRLNIPPSSVVYYKDRFAQHIPVHQSKGRRSKYPKEALTIFKEIRTMFENNWSAEEIEQVLAQKFGATPTADIQEGCFIPPEPENEPLIQELAGVIDKMSNLLENQNLFRSEIDSLRSEITQLRTERDELEQRYQARVEQLEEEIAKLRQDRAQTLHDLLEHMNQAGGPYTAPPEAFTTLPLVIKKGEDEYLGVAGKTRHFSLSEFVRIIDRNGNTNKNVALAWRREPGKWVLTINTYDLDSGAKHEHVLHVRQTITPNQNNVVELIGLSIDGNSVPEPFLLVLLRKIKDGFDE